MEINSYTEALNVVPLLSGGVMLAVSKRTGLLSGLEVQVD